MTNHTIETRTEDEAFTAVAFGSTERAELAGWVPDGLLAVQTYLEKFGVGPKGAPFLRVLDGEAEAGYRATTPVGGEGAVEPSDLPAGTVAVTVHEGGDATFDEAHAALRAWIAEQGGTPIGSPWENLLDGRLDGRREVVQPYS